MPARRPLRITRFTVMATLQAARVRRLGFSEPAAYSWGLNRAIFYAAARRGFGGMTQGQEGGAAATTRAENLYSIGDDEAYRDPTYTDLRFTIGGETQTEEAFRKQVAARFGPAANFGKAWKEATQTVEAFDETVLRSGRRFYAEVYKPRRDELVSQWTAEFLGPVTQDPAARRPRTGARRGSLSSSVGERAPPGRRR